MFRFGRPNDLAASDVIRSMKRMGFPHDEIYDVLIGIGLPGEQVQLLIDRVSAELQEAKIEPRPSRLGAEVREIFDEKLQEMQLALSSKLNSFSQDLQLLNAEVEKLGKRILDLQAIESRSQLKMNFSEKATSKRRRRGKKN